MTHKIGRGALVALIAAGSIALGAGASVGAPVIINATIDNAWDPPTRHVKKGGKVVWKSPAFGEEHNIRAYGGNWTFNKPLDIGDSVGKRFKKTGTFRFFCDNHGDTKRVDGKLVCTGMCGKVKVHK